MSIRLSMSDRVLINGCSRLTMKLMTTSSRARNDRATLISFTMYGRT